MSEFEKKEGYEREDIFSKAIRAGKRTYFFDVKATRNDDYYLTITERKRRYEQDGSFQVEKHKIFLYKEDFEKFSAGLNEVVEFIQKEKGNHEMVASDAASDKSFTQVEFDDLEK